MHEKIKLQLLFYTVFFIADVYLFVYLFCICFLFKYVCLLA